MKLLRVLRDQRGAVQVGMNLVYIVIASVATLVLIGGLQIYDSAALPNDDAFATRVAAENVATDFDQACQYNSQASGAATGAGPTSFTVPPSVARTDPKDTRPLPTTFSAVAQGVGARGLQLNLNSTTTASSVVIPCKSDGIPPGTTLTAP